MKRMADGVDYLFWTFGGEVPGQFIRVREGDLVEFHLKNHPTSKMPHNIDLHAVTGPGRRRGFVLHRARPRVAVFLQGAESRPLRLSLRDRAGRHARRQRHVWADPRRAEGRAAARWIASIYVMQGDFYTTGTFGEEGLQPFDQEKAVDEKPELRRLQRLRRIARRATTRCKAKVGETVRLFVGNGGPNLVSSFHVIGEIFDHVYQEGGIDRRAAERADHARAGGRLGDRGFQTRSARHLHPRRSLALPRLQQRRARHAEGRGPQNLIVYSGKEVDEVYLGDGTLPSADAKVASLQAQMKKAIASDPKIAGLTQGNPHRERQARVCADVLRLPPEEGQGLPGVFPPLAKSDYLMADKDRAIRGIIKGQAGR